MQPFDALYEHPLVASVLADAVAADRAATDRDVNEFEFYVQRCGFALSHALTWCKQLDHATEFLVNFDHSKKLRTTRADHLIYSVENYLIRLNSVYDRSLQLVNAFFHLCIDSEHVSHAVIISNLRVQHRPSVVTEMKKLRKLLSKYAQDRHALVHRHSLMDEKLRRIELCYLHPPERVHKDPERARNFGYFRANSLREYVVDRKQEFASVNLAVAGTLSDILTALKPEYEEQGSSFRARGF